MLQHRFLIGLAIAGLVAGTAGSAQQAKSAASPAKAPASASPVLVFEFVKGTVEIETYPTDSPKSVAHVIDLVRTGFYRGLRVHWAKPGVVQFGDPLTKDMTKRDLWGSGGSGHPVGLAETSARKFERGMVGLGYRQEYSPKTADSQIFILTSPNPALNGKYAMLGHVSDGMAVVDKLDVPDVIRNAYIKGEKK